MAAWVSRLMIYDLDEGSAFPVLETEHEIAAPNWTPDGSALVVNGEGSLYWVELDAPELLEIDTGLCIKLNNDHGISPDGEVLYFSDHTFGGGAQIWRQDLGSDEDPVKVTQKRPSWYHGISPDGRMICYTAVREGLFGIYTSKPDGAQETCVIEGAHHYDGPDFSADGDWIWFNSDRTGASELWRVRPDGADLERMTEDGLVNWFPHPSPDGEHVVYLAYPEGTIGHPPGMHVALRLWSAKDKPVATLVELTGGQGTINVPSWSPDGRAFAYVEYAS
ncbi:TolB family protein [Celeribacter neptunius]|uniref:WD40-like Beta Propeller Repeat n=1 Tax=Celeribacter neptunius TaxID=588602 RepID=A0A1I3LTP8_9RHOB|nr:TolB family protein [Celeribacter neptunius]SFI88148.1 WD40-like Beta Propeller Repeat [Celeribacter neptunius]